MRIPDGRAFAGDAVVVAVGGHAGRLPIPGAELTLTYEQLAELQPAFPTFTEAVSVAAADIVRHLGVAAWAPTWSELRPAGVTPDG